LGRGSYQWTERVQLDAPDDGAWLTMPCASADGWFGVKQVSVLPANAAAGRPSVQAWYTLMDPTGAPVLGVDAGGLTKLRTSAVSALAADTLAPPSARTLLVVGTGALAPWMARAHLQVRAYETVRVWGRRRERAEAVVATILSDFAGAAVRPAIAVADDLEAAVREADVVSVATTARSPLVHGAWLRPGQHLDLVGAFTPSMRESDTDAVTAAQVIVDDRLAARAEAGDLIQAAAEGWSWDAVAGDLADLLAGRVTPAADRPTLFKSVGVAIEDLAVARLLAGR
jgi:ornithine cyclodeaminase/alanine dehydrogenase-like protein (mu-crystallin family)